MRKRHHFSRICRSHAPVSSIQLEPLEPRQLMSVDLSGSFTNGPTQVFTGTRPVVTLSINNNGDSKFHGRLSVRFFIVADGADFDPATATGGIIVSKRTSIAAGGSVQRTFRLPLPRTIGTGDFRVVAVVDPNNRVAESDETNNVAESSPFVVTPRPIDIVPTFRVSQANPVTVVSGRHTLATLRVTLTNEGTESMNSGQSVDISAVARPVGAINDSQDIVITKSGTHMKVGALGSGDSRTAFIPVNFPPSTPPGDFNILLTADPNNKLAETDEFNNTAVLATPITVASASSTASAILISGSGATVVPAITVVPVTATTSGTTTVIPIGGVGTTTFNFANNSSLGLVPTSGAFAATPTGVVTTPATATGFVPTTTTFVSTQPTFVATTPTFTTVPTTIVTQPIGTTLASIAPTAGLTLLPQPVGTVNTVPQTVNLGLFPTTTVVSTGTSSFVFF